MPLLDQILRAVSIPVIAAGGIATAEGVASAVAAGADGVRVGTRFIASEESEAHPLWVQAVIDADAEDSVVSDAFNVGLPQPGPHRVLRRTYPCSVSRRIPRRGGRRARSRRCRSMPGAPRAQ
jgi:NAD(P)H-dependent flavin oxidoreductase YrpB (nitropropane dioxygenase family)